MGFEPMTSMIPVIYQLFRHLANEHNFWNRSTFLKKHHIPSRSLKESFSGNSVKISDCWAFSPFETLPGCRAFRHSELFLLSSLKVPCCMSILFAIQIHVIPQVFASTVLYYSTVSKKAF